MQSRVHRGRVSTDWVSRDEMQRKGRDDSKMARVATLVSIERRMDKQASKVEGEGQGRRGDWFRSSAGT
jgi:hypothetical protein